MSFSLNIPKGITLNVNVIGLTDPAALAALARMETGMSELSAKLDKLDASLTKLEDRNTEDIAHIKAQLDALQAKVDAGTVTDAEKARFDELTAKVDAMDIDPAFPTKPVEPTA